MVLRLLDASDPVLASEAITAAIDELIGDGDRDLMLEVVTEADYRNDDGVYETTKLGVATSTPPFLTDRRVVVGRNLHRFPTKDEYEAVIDILEQRLDTTDLLLVWERGNNPATGKPDPKTHPRLPPPLKKAIEAAGGSVVKVSTGERKAGDDWVRDQLEASTLDFDSATRRAILDLVGEDRSRVIGLVRTLEGALGAGAAVTLDDIRAHGGDAGTVMPWDLDDAIDRGDVAGSLDLLHRILPGSSPFQLMAMWANRYGRMLRLDGSGISDEKAAAKVLGMKGSTFPAKKALQQGRKLGSEKVARAVRLLAEADMQLRGTVDWPEELVMEVLVARLAALSRR